MSHASEVETEAMVRRLGELAKQRREEIGVNRAKLAKEAEIDSEETITAFEFGKILPSADTQRKLEKALSWRLGVIEKIMEATGRAADTLRMEELDAEDSLHLDMQGGVTSLTSATDAELLAEVARRGL